MAAGLTLAPGRGGAEAATALACLPETAATAALCEALRGLIAEARPDLDLLRVSAAALPDHPDALRLSVRSLREDGIVARLDWRRAGQDWQEGPEMSLVTLDTRLSQPLIHQFLQSLWTQGPGGL